MRFHRRRSRDVPRTSRALPRLPQLAEANCDPCTPSPLPKLWRSPQGTARACPRCDPRPPESGSLSPRRHPSADRSPRPFLRIAPRRVAASGLAPSEEETWVPSCRCDDLGLPPARHPPKRMPDIIAVDQTGVRRQRRRRSLELTAAL